MSRVLKFTPKEKVGLVVAGLLFGGGVAIMLSQKSWNTFYPPVAALGIVWSVLHAARARRRCEEDSSHDMHSGK